MLGQVYQKVRNDKKLHMLLSLTLTESLSCENYLDYSELKTLDFMQDTKKIPSGKTIGIRTRKRVANSTGNVIGIRRRCQ